LNCIHNDSEWLTPLSQVEHDTIYRCKHLYLISLFEKLNMS